MELKDCIASAIAEFPKIVTPETASRVGAAIGATESVFCDLFAKEVATSYLGGTLTWTEGNAAMNALSGYFFLHLPKESLFPDYAYAVFLAFDAGETSEEPDNERITKEQLGALHAKAK